MKKILILCLILAMATMLFGCGNMQLIDTTYSFEKAVISLPNGEVIEGKVDRWTDYENSDMIQVTIDGETYLTHISNVVLISE